jgi:prepilin-type N-terminal cleavage/methylation domain-containing protein
MVNQIQNRIHANRAGFSLLEVMVVTAISMVITMTAVPNMVNGIGNMRLRSSMTSLAGVLQNCRMLAVKQNQTMSTHFSVRTYGTTTGVTAYVKKASDTNPLSTSDSQVQLEEPVTQVTTPSGPSAPPALDSTTLSFTPQTGDPSFLSTGLPCAYSGGNCLNTGFIYYFHDARPGIQMGWAALSISPAGRLKKWYWNGSAWTD